MSCPTSHFQQSPSEGNQVSGQLLILGITISEKPIASTLPHKPGWSKEPTPARIGSRWRRHHADQSPTVWEQIPQRPKRSRAFSLMELDATLSVPSRETAATTVGLLKSLGYTGVRLGPLDPLLAPGERAAAQASIDNLASTLKDHGLSVSVTLAGGRVDSESDGVAALRKLDPRLSEHFFVDPAATNILHRDLADFRTSLPVSELAPSAVLFDSGLFSYHMECADASSPPDSLNKWATWLRERHHNQAELEKAWQVPGQSPPLLPDDNLVRSKIELLSLSHILAASPRFRIRIGDQITFLDDLQREWFLDQKNFADRNLPPSLERNGLDFARMVARHPDGTLRFPRRGRRALRTVQTGRSHRGRKGPVFGNVPLSPAGMEDFLTPYYRWPESHSSSGTPPASGRATATFFALSAPW